LQPHHIREFDLLRGSWQDDYLSMAIHIDPSSPFSAVYPTDGGDGGYRDNDGTHGGEFKTMMNGSIARHDQSGYTNDG
jgi:hypothetical protein